MRRLPAIKPLQAIRALQRAGFVVDHVTGSHYIMLHPEGRRVVVPYHGGHDLKRGILMSIIEQSGLTPEEFLSLL